MKTRIAKNKIERVKDKYFDYAEKYMLFTRGNNIPQARIYQDRMKTIRMVLSLLDIHIEGINKFKN